ncbi:ATP-binding cassette domain-containing protein [Streptomyces sp. NBC_01808]|uniref:ABC transporter ATP-binding protein n=1 Tax=Streptomyces sp. NBC_01808 TaxID=2975947 RepID=UPI002DDA845A|nr:ATP-binding cassette domain-containing protein [Streptomyces sp. NBC_01808]WSA39170.1 ATP-binding cassette domain-containing protein [Streptomyces sp. NBC_01808]
MTTRTPAVEAAGLRKAYGGREVVAGVDLTVPAGTVYALLGPNGAGKTTTVRILTTLLAADAGTARVAGHDIRRAPARVRAAIGVTGQFSAVDGVLTGRENLRLMADLGHLEGPRARAVTAELLARFGLADAADRRAATYSGGMKRRLDLAMTLVSGPRLIFLDEPTTGLDPRSRRELWDVVRELVADGTTVFLTTQYLEEADRLADRIGVLDGGRLVAEGTAAGLKRRVTGGHVELHAADAARAAELARRLPGAVADPAAPAVAVPYDGSLGALRRLLAGLDDDGSVTGLAVHTPDLDDVFLALTGHAAAAAEGVRA